jgi:hypothetical protein
MTRLAPFVAALALAGCGDGSFVAPADEFGAWYTHLDRGEPWEEASRTGEYTDLVVDLGQRNGQLVFARHTSYLPVWETRQGAHPVPEIVARRGDGETPMPDRVNTYAHVRLLHADEHTVTVHWRYLPSFGAGNPHVDVDPRAMVDEVFQITPDGDVHRDTPLGTQTFRLTRHGIDRVVMEVEEATELPARVQGQPVRSPAPGMPAWWWPFDEGLGAHVTETVHDTRSEVAGHEVRWREGVSGTALLFDGHGTAVGADDAAPAGPARTLEAWVAIGAYPWNRCPLVQHAGLSLELDAAGVPALVFADGERAAGPQSLERQRWFHLAGTFDGDELRLYVDGIEVGRRIVSGAVRTPGSGGVTIGRSPPRAATDGVRQHNYPRAYSFDGLIDEVRVHDEALSASDVQRAFAALDPGEGGRSAPDLPARALPLGPPLGRFGAMHVRLAYHDGWDDQWQLGEHADVVVDFDDRPTRVVFWHGASYVPLLVDDRGHAFSNGFNETWDRSGGRGCHEPISDKGSLTSHVRVIEETDARVVVHWRYALRDVFGVIANLDEDTGWGDWADQVLTIYPDGVVVRDMRLWSSGVRDHEWQESMVLFGPGERPEQIIEAESTLVMVDLDGGVVRYDWGELPPADVTAPARKRIQQVNLTGDYDPVTIGHVFEASVYDLERTSWSPFPAWNHWPAAAMPTDGRFARADDRAGHSSLTHLKLSEHAEDRSGPTPYVDKLLLEGTLDADPADLVRLARSWLQPPELDVTGGGAAGGYDPTRRAWRLDATGRRPLQLRIEASTESPVVNPCFVVRSWDTARRAVVAVDGEPVTEGLRQGIARDTDGSKVLVIWLPLEAEGPLGLTITGAVD